jgi:excisionase family DNA binding protein
MSTQTPTRDRTILLSPADAARLAQDSRDTIYREIERGALPALHVGRLLRIDPDTSGPTSIETERTMAKAKRSAHGELDELRQHAATERVKTRDLDTQLEVAKREVENAAAAVTEAYAAEAPSW